MTQNDSSVPLRQVAAGTTAWNRRTWKRAALRSTTITPTALNVLLYIEEEHSNWATGGDVWPACATIGEALGMTRQTVLGHMQKLERAGWIIQTQPATKRTPARYRLSFGEHRPFGTSGTPTSQRSEIPTSDPDQRSEIPTSEVGDSDLQRSEIPTRTEVFNRSLNSSSSVAPEPSDERSPEPRREEEAPSMHDEQPTATSDNPDTALRHIIATWPNKRARGQLARENTDSALRDILDRGISGNAVLDAIHDGKRDGSITPDSWPDAWLNQRFHPETMQREQNIRAAAARKAATEACSRCDEHGFIEYPPSAGALYPTVARCKHTDPTREPRSSGPGCSCEPCYTRRIDHACSPGCPCRRDCVQIAAA